MVSDSLSPKVHRDGRFKNKRKKRSRRNLHCMVHFLNKTSQAFRLHGKDKGRDLMNQVVLRFGLREPQYFGLSFIDEGSASRWLDPDKTLKHQLGCSTGEVHLTFGVKFYVENPSRLLSEQTRWLFFLQCWEKVINGSLPITPQTSCLLTCYYLQVTHGPITSEAEDLENISKLDRIPLAVKENAPVIVELRELLKAQSIDRAQSNFLDHVRRVELYGIDLHLAKDSDGKPILVGVSSNGVTVYRRTNHARINTFAWCKILRVFYKKKRLFLQLQREKFEEYDTVVGFLLQSQRAAKRLWKSCIEQHSFFRLGRPVDPQQVSKGVWPIFRKLLSVQSCYTVGENQAKATERRVTTYRRYDNLHKIQSTFVEASPRMAWSTSIPGSLEDEETRFGIKHSRSSSIESPASSTVSTAFAPNGLQSIHYVDEDSQVDLRLPLYLEDSSPLLSPDSQSKDQFDVKLTPDSTGKFGFNLRFEKERSSARLSRLIPNSSADTSYPPLHVGDEVLAVNGHPVACLSPTELVELFNAAKQSSLTLSLRRGGYQWTEQDEDQSIQYIQEPADMTAKESVEAIEEGLRNGRILSHFDLLPRSRPELSTSIARRDENFQKNRYGDIFPYDCNRVVLKSCFQDGDYINGSYINIPLPGSNNTLRYIATQGPLPHTVEDFWLLVWQHEKIRTLAMVTAEFERGRTKCHRYWPEEDEIVRAGDLIITCQMVTDLGHYIHRELLITNDRTEETRLISHLQYIDWPDHGAPLSTSQFLEYIRHIQRLNINMVDGEDDGNIILVHCSAGIGRTGAFILLDAALHLLDMDFPANPIQLIKLMRDQRPMMLQTSVQFQYVCECIIDSLKGHATLPTASPLQNLNTPESDNSSFNTNIESQYARI